MTDGAQSNSTKAVESHRMEIDSRKTIVRTAQSESAREGMEPRALPIILAGFPRTPYNESARPLPETPLGAIWAPGQIDCRQGLGEIV